MSDSNYSFSNIKLFLFDMDGTLYLGNRLFDFTKELLEAIKKKGASYLYLTNNSSKSVNSYIEKLGKMGIVATEDEFCTSSQVMLRHLKLNYPGKTLYVCGTESFKKELRGGGFTITEDIDKTEVIVMGFDTELTFKKLSDICEMLCTRELPYLATNLDVVCPTEFGSVPDCGSVSEMIFNATGKRPQFLGKPEPAIAELAMEKKEATKEETCVIGDRIYTDVESGKRAGVLSVLVMSGETTKEILDSSKTKPDLVLDSAKEILKSL